MASPPERSETDRGTRSVRPAPWRASHRRGPAAPAACPARSALSLRAGVLLAALICGACASDDAARPEAPTPAAAREVSGDGNPEVDSETGGSTALDAAIDASSSTADAGTNAAVDDGWPDASEFLSKKYGFLPIAVPITEPAVGYGLAGGLAFISKPLGQAAGFGRPNITFVGGFGTENDTRGVVVGDVRHWFDDRVQTVAGLIRSSVNLDFYGLGDGRNGEPLRYNLEPEGGLVQAKVRVGDSALWAGLGYAYARTAVSFEAPEGTARLPDFERESHVGGITPSLTWDTRDNIFTPTEGTYVEASVGIFTSGLGSDTDFQRPHLLAMHFRPLAPTLFLGVRGQITSAFGDAPFYLDPFVALRGVPIMRYQGETAADLEVELRWQVWNRVSLVGFGGAGATWSDLERRDGTESVTSGGFGLRYELARAYGIHVGLDVAFSGDSSAIYVQIGSPWARP